MTEEPPRPEEPQGFAQPPEPEELPEQPEAPTMSREEGILSGGVGKVIGMLLAAAIIGGGAYLLVAGVDDLDLPEIDLSGITESNTTGDGAVTNLENTTIEEGTFGEPAADAADPFTSAAFGGALTAVRGELGPRAEATRLFINEVQTQFIARDGDEVEAYSVRADSGSLERQSATITITGNAEVEDFAFSLGSVDPNAVDRILAQATKLAGDEFEPDVLSL
ncbi:MAG: hypothetical protein L0206_16585, partial [Actinobacteria bacterium]|nr:hypothetical protein [Actinomycetota bacterium]